MRPWLLLLLALPLSAEELQVDVTGRAFDPQTQASGTFTVTFDIDTLSGIQSYNVGGPLTSYSAASLAITNLSADVNGVNLFSVPSATASLDKGASPFVQFATQGPGSLLWNFDVSGWVSVSDRDDPLFGLLTKSFAPFYGSSQLTLQSSGSPRSFLGDDITVRFSPVSVAEPGIPALLLAGFGALAWWHRRARPRRELPPARA